MAAKFRFFLGLLWAAPITVACFLLYVVPLWSMRWYEYVGFHELAWVWKLREDAPDWLHRRWKGWAGHAFGNIVVVVEKPNISRYTWVILTHELQHVRQYMRLGVLQPIMYFLTYFAIRWACKNSHAYYDNPFELDARRGAGQTVDVQVKARSNRAN